MCKKPFLCAPVGLKSSAPILSEGAREALTPHPCGKCMHCRFNKAREWTNRIMLETLVHEESTFVTLTYHDDFLPCDGSLIPKEMTDFIKRLRARIEPIKIRYFGVGEYGEKSERPHYHLIIFGIGPQYEEVIRKAWPYGFVMAGDVTRGSARYCTGYVVKGWRESLYEGKEKLNGRHPEFMRCSKMGGGLGYGAVLQIAEKLKGKKLDRVVREVRIGRKKYPLGRYLTDKLADLLEYDFNKREMEYYEFQKGIFDKHLTDNGGAIYVDRIFEEDRIKRLQQVKRNKIYKQRRSV